MEQITLNQVGWMQPETRVFIGAGEIAEADAMATGCQPVYTIAKRRIKVKSTRASPVCPIGAIIDLYHSRLPAAPRVMLRNDVRDGHIRARWNDLCSKEGLTAKEGLEFFDNLFASVAASKFLTGRVTSSRDSRPFIADLDWLMRPTNFVKVCEGKYRG